MEIQRQRSFLVCHFSCVKDGNDATAEETFSDKHLRAEIGLPAYAADPSTSPPEQKITPFSLIPKSLVAQYSNHHAAVLTASGEQLDTSTCSTSSPSMQCTTLQERMDLEMSVLRKQEAVLKLQEEYYRLKIHLMKKKMADAPLKD